MARIPLITTRDQVLPEHRELFDAVVGRRGSVVGPYRVLLHHPHLARLAADLGGYLRFDGQLDRQTAELTIITAAREWDCYYVWGDHEPLARQAGVPAATVKAVGEGIAPVGLGPEEADIVTYVQQLVRQHGSEEALYRRLEARLGTAGLVELTMMLGYYSMLAAVLNGYEVSEDPGKPRMPARAG